MIYIILCHVMLWHIMIMYTCGFQFQAVSPSPLQDEQPTAVASDNTTMSELWNFIRSCVVWRPSHFQGGNAALNHGAE